MLPEANKIDTGHPKERMQRVKVVLRCYTLNKWVLAVHIAAHCQSNGNELRIPEPSHELLAGLKAAGITMYRESLNVLLDNEMLGPETYYKPPWQLMLYA